MVGALPPGFPPLAVPTASWSGLGVLTAGALGVTLVSVTDTISTASAFTARSGQELRGNQKMIGIGAANIAVSFFQGFPVSAGARVPR